MHDDFGRCTLYQLAKSCFVENISNHRCGTHRVELRRAFWRAAHGYNVMTFLNDYGHKLPANRTGPLQ